MTSLASPNTLRSAAAAALLLAVATAAHAADITQTVNPGSTVNWNNAIWGTPAAAPTTGDPANNYFSATGLFTSASTNLNYNVTGRVRAILGATTFAGDSLTMVGVTELLMKQREGQIASANLILDGGLIRYAPDTSTGASYTAGLAGTLTIASESYIGVNHSATATLSISAALLGDDTLNIRAGGAAPTKTISFSGDLSAYTGTIVLGNGAAAATLNFAQDYTDTSFGLAMGGFGTVDILNLTNTLTVGSFSFSSTLLDPGAYTVSDLNGLFGTGNQFTGTGNLIVGAIPEPSAYAVIAGMAGLALAGARRRRA